jgi:very-short-patch-repair endonuclease
VVRLRRERGWSRRGLVVDSSHARGRTQRASAANHGMSRRGAGAPPAPMASMTRIDNKPLFRSNCTQRAALLEARARDMRHIPTSAEELLWQTLRARQLGVVFRRQVPLLGRFIADFYAAERRLVIEVDGDYHGQRARADQRREALLTRAGYRVLRIRNELVLCELPAALEIVRAAVWSR